MRLVTRRKTATTTDEQKKTHKACFYVFYRVCSIYSTCHIKILSIFLYHNR